VKFSTLIKYLIKNIPTKFEHNQSSYAKVMHYILTLTT
jgi:hypothetical protein